MDNINFLAFWFALNAALKDHGHPEMSFQNARYYWGIAHEELPKTRPAHSTE